MLGQGNLLRSADVQTNEAYEWRHLSQVHAGTLTAVRQTTLSDLHGKSMVTPLRDETQNVAHKQRKTEGPPVLEVPTDLQDMEIPLEDMGNVIVLTGL